jgi:hypothetical protein
MTARTHRPLLRYAALAAGALACAACGEGAAASPGGPVAATDAGAAGEETGFAVCPPALDATFTSILNTILQTPSCGTNVTGNCHSASGSASSGTGNLLDFTLDAGGVYAELVGDGGGAPSTNIAGSAGHIPRVAPFDAGASMLYIKLTLTTRADPRYGSGMPLTAPGSVCPATLDAVKAWIDNGAAND